MAKRDENPKELEEFLKQIRDARAINESARKAILIKQRDFEQLAASQRKMSLAIESVRLTKTVLHKQSSIAKMISDLRNTIKESIAPDFSRLRKSLEDIPERTRDALILLGEHGWYLDPEMTLPDLWRLEKALSDGDVEEAENALVEYFGRRLLDIKASVASKFQHRSHLIESAFDAHDRGCYELCIPVLLAQVDGICKEIVDQYLFIKKDRKPQTAVYVSQIATDTYKAALLSPLATALPIGKTESERSDSFNALNRHTVLHGESLDYGTKANSLKAISLLNYVSYVLHTVSK